MTGRGAKGLGPRCRLSGRAQVVHQVARRQRHADRAFAKALSVRRDDVGARFHASACQRNVRRDDDCVWPGPLGDPVVRGVCARPDDDPLNLQRPRDHERAVCDNENCQPLASRDAIDLILHRTGVGVDKDTQLWSGRFHVGAVGDQSHRINRRARPSGWRGARPLASRQRGLLPAAREGRTAAVSFRPARNEHASPEVSQSFRCSGRTSPSRSMGLRSAVRAARETAHLLQRLINGGEGRRLSFGVGFRRRNHSREKRPWPRGAHIPPRRERKK